MSCEQMRELISADADGELATDERAQLAAHLEGCAACRNYAAQLEELKTQLSALPRRLPVDARGVLAEARGRQSGRRRVGRVQLLAGALAASLLVVVGIALLRSWRGDSGPAPRLPARGSSLPAGGSGVPSSDGRADLRGQRRPWAPRLIVSARDDKGRSRLWRVLVGTGLAEPLTAPPPGSEDRDPLIDPAGERLVFTRVTARRRQLRWRSSLDGGQAGAWAAQGESWAARFLCNDRLRVISDALPAAKRTHLSARELDLALPTRRKDETQRGAAEARLLRRGAPHLWRVPTSWSRDRCVRTRLLEQPLDAAGHLALTLEVSSCRGGLDDQRRWQKPYREVARWPLSIGDNVRDARVSPDGRHIAVLLDRGRVGERPAPAPASLLYLITLGGPEGAKPAPIAIEGEDDPGAMVMDNHGNFLSWRRLASEVLGRPRWSADSSQLCFLRQEGRHRGAWCFSPRRASSRRVGGQDARLRFVVPDPQGRSVALQSEGPTAQSAGLLQVVRLKDGHREIVTVRGLLADSPPAWLPSRGPGVPCAP